MATPGASRRTVACRICRKNKRRCVHDQSGKIDPEKADSAPVRRTNKADQRPPKDRRTESGGARREESSTRLEVGKKFPGNSLDGGEGSDGVDMAGFSVHDSSVTTSEEEETSGDVEMSASDPDSRSMVAGKMYHQSNAVGGGQKHQFSYPDLRTVVMPTYQGRQQNSKIPAPMTYPHPTHASQLRPLNTSSHLSTSTTNNNNSQDPFQLITPATTPTLPPIQRFPPMDFSQGARIPVLHVPKAQLKRERQEEALAKARGQLSPPKFLPGTTIKLNVGLRSSGRVGGGGLEETRFKGLPEQKQADGSPKQRKNPPFELALPTLPELPGERSPERPSTLTVEPKQRRLAPPDVCTVHGPGCLLPLDNCQVDQFTWFNATTGKHEIRTCENIPQRRGKLGKFRPDFESVGIETRVGINQTTGMLEEKVLVRTGKSPDTPGYAYDRWIGNFAFPIDDTWVKQVCLSMQNRRADNEVPRVVTPASMVDDVDAPRSGWKWLRYRDEKGEERLSEIDHWGYLLEEVEWKWRERAKAKLVEQGRTMLAQRVARDCVAKEMRMQSLMTEFVTDEENGFVAKMVSAEEIKDVAVQDGAVIGVESAEMIEEVTKGVKKQTSWKQAIINVQLGYRRKDDNGQEDDRAGAESEGS